MPVTVRPYRPDDLGQVLQLWERAGDVPPEDGAFTVDELVGILNSEDPLSLVAEIDGRIAGVVVGSTTSVVGWIFEVSVAPGSGAPDDLMRRLIEAAEAACGERGARRLIHRVVPGSPVAEALADSGYVSEDRATYVHRKINVAKPPTMLAELGGRMVDPDLWDSLRGMVEAKEIIERRVILPLARPDLAERHAVAPPKAIVLFGPPGTGKTTFAKGIASRLQWPFVEVHPPELTEEGPERQAKLLVRTFDRILELPAAVVFIDEVEEIASARAADRKVGAGLTTELLKQIPRFRETTEHLLVCATNWIGRLDDAFIRPGRFDYLLPVGPPDTEARRAIWSRYTEEITDLDVDLDGLVGASEFFTPADIEFAARKAAQRAFEREHFNEGSHRASTDDFLEAIEGTRPTLTREIVEEFSSDTKEFGRY